MDESALTGTYEKWRQLIFRANICFAGIILIAEICIYFVLQWSDLILQPLPEYLCFFLILPALCNLLILEVGFALARHLPPHSRAQDYIPILQLAAICVVCTSVHCVFSVLLATFCFPIFTTVLFNDKRMTRRVTGICLLLLSLTLLLRFLTLKPTSYEPYLLPEGIIAGIFLLSANLICEILARFQNEKNRIIQEGYEHQLKMREQLNKDQKTGLYGATALRGALCQAIGQAVESGTPLALAILDIDDFKRVNDTCGHAQGDQVLLTLSALMQHICAQGQILARFGGEEFAVVFENVPPEEALCLMETLRQEFSRQHYDFMQGVVTISIGIARWVPGWSDQELFNRADAAMYRAKSRGKNQTVWWENTTQPTA